MFTTETQKRGRGVYREGEEKSRLERVASFSLPLFLSLCELCATSVPL
jgi:hypothetical protein